MKIMASALVGGIFCCGFFFSLSSMSASPLGFAGERQLSIDRSFWDELHNVKEECGDLCRKMSKAEILSTNKLMSDFLLKVQRMLDETEYIIRDVSLPLEGVPEIFSVSELYQNISDFKKIIVVARLFLHYYRFELITSNTDDLKFVLPGIAYIIDSLYCPLKSIIDEINTDDLVKFAVDVASPEFLIRAQGAINSVDSFTK